MCTCFRNITRFKIHLAIAQNQVCPMSLGLPNGRELVGGYPCVDNLDLIKHVQLGPHCAWSVGIRLKYLHVCFILGNIWPNNRFTFRISKSSGFFDCQRSVQVIANILNCVRQKKQPKRAESFSDILPT